MGFSTDAQGGRRYLAEIDLLKTLAFFFMVIIHIYENFAYFEIYPYPESITDHIIQFVGGPIAAPAFMLALGIGIVYTSHGTPREFAKRGLQIFVIAYILNFLRGGMWYVIGGEEFVEIFRYCFNVDILHLAGLSFMLVGLLKHLRLNHWHILAVAIVMYIIGTLFDGHDFGEYTNMVVGLLLPVDDGMVCFPLLTWFIYIAAGIIFGSMVKGSPDAGRFYQKVLNAGVFLIVVSTILILATNGDFVEIYTIHNDLYYHQSPLQLIWIFGLLFIEIPLLFFILESLGSKKIDSALRVFSRNIPQMYYIQWVAIGWIYAIYYLLELKPDNLAVALTGLVVFAVTFALAPVFNRVKARLVPTVEKR